MLKTISQAEKHDLLLALAFVFEKKLAADPGDGARLSETAERYFGAFGHEELSSLLARARFLDEIPEDKRNRWQDVQLEKIRRRGRTARLDENINPSHLAEYLSRESKAVQELILANLPPDLSRRIAFYLELNFEIRHLEHEVGQKKVNDEISSLVKRKFLANFVAFEDLHEPDVIDNLTIDGLEELVRHLGLREIAIACRGINSKETLAAFLNRFNEDDAREIASYITELEKIRPYWVAQADELVRQSWSADLPTELVLKKIGLRLLAVLFTGRDETSRCYAAQKLPPRESRNWLKLVRDNEKTLQTGDEETRSDFLKRQKTLQRLAEKFSEQGRL